MTYEQLVAVQNVLGEVADERVRQHAKWGEQNLDSFASAWPLLSVREEVRRRKEWNDHAAEHGFSLTFDDILREEVAEVRAERDPAKLRAELIQVAAVAVQWVEKLDREARR